MKEVAAVSCGRENDLVGFLYGELNENEARSFTQHLRECSSCRGERADFAGIHESMLAWRDESLGGLAPSPAPLAELAGVGQEKPSAWAAVRQFFNLAPLWLKGAVAFASILFCVLAALAGMRLQERELVPIGAYDSPAPSQLEVNAMVERRVQEELARQRNLTAQTLNPPGSVAGNNSPRQPRINRRGESIAASVAVKAQRPLSRTEREQLAADLRLTSARNDGDVELLDDRINE
jgi:Putative zinc-finger